jgi:hypothetical protein
VATVAAIGIVLALVLVALAGSHQNRCTTAHAGFRGRSAASCAALGSGRLQWWR